jgi:hypothetical protein
MLTTTTNTLGWSVSQSADTQKCTPALQDPAPANHGHANHCTQQMRHTAAAAGLLRRLWHWGTCAFRGCTALLTHVSDIGCASLQTEHHGCWHSAQACVCVVDPAAAGTAANQPCVHNC